MCQAKLQRTEFVQPHTTPAQVVEHMHDELSKASFSHETRYRIRSSKQPSTMSLHTDQVQKPGPRTTSLAFFSVPSKFAFVSKVHGLRWGILVDIGSTQIWPFEAYRARRCNNVQSSSVHRTTGKPTRQPKNTVIYKQKYILKDSGSVGSRSSITSLHASFPYANIRLTNIPHIPL